MTLYLDTSATPSSRLSGNRGLVEARLGSGGFRATLCREIWRRSAMVDPACSRPSPTTLFMASGDSLCRGGSPQINAMLLNLLPQWVP